MPPPKEQEKIAGKSQIHTETVQSRLIPNTSKALCELQSAVFIVEKSVVMVYNKLLIFSGVTGDPGKAE